MTNLMCLSLSCKLGDLQVRRSLRYLPTSPVQLISLDCLHHGHWDVCSKWGLHILIRSEHHPLHSCRVWMLPSAQSCGLSHRGHCLGETQERLLHSLRSQDAVFII